MIKLLPHWVLTGVNPNVFDSESVSSIEANARLYGKMQELIEDYNKFVDEINKAITEYTTSDKTDTEEFKTCLTNLIENYIKSIDLKIDNQDLIIKNQDLKIANQDLKIEENLTYIKNNINETIEAIVNDMYENGEINSALTSSFNNLDLRVGQLEKTEYRLVYDELTEEITLEKFINNGGV